MQHFKGVPGGMADGQDQRFTGDALLPVDQGARKTAVFDLQARELCAEALVDL